ncbi:hypothetical protein GOB93_03355 [Acetobacter musti]|uniref:Uncharacterized protein n=1 Tax=Acetobacter musti TaxID=864732 RepID=A0ABX0JNP7_9PROT|nr:hypothetical protein [Acetobacter musti]NHN83677.1 hypothetical protein [Acetobacter musti]
MSSDVVYAVYLTEAADGHPVGYVVNNVMWTGSGTMTIPSGQACVSDPSRQYPIGSVYEAPSS